MTLHTPLNEETRGLIGERALGLMRSSAYLINCARGPIVDEAALVAALRDGSIAGAGLDVMESASPPAEHPMFGLDNVIVTPHVALHSCRSSRCWSWRCARPRPRWTCCRAGCRSSW